MPRAHRRQAAKSTSAVDRAGRETRETTCETVPPQRAYGSSAPSRLTRPPHESLLVDRTLVPGRRVCLPLGRRSQEARKDGSGSFTSSPCEVHVCRDVFSSIPPGNGNG